MEKSLNFEIVKNTSLEKFYEYLRNDEVVFNDKINRDIIFIDCRKIIEYIIKEIIFYKNGLGAYEKGSIRSLKGNIECIKEILPQSIYRELEYIRFAGNKYAHELDKNFNHETCLEYTYKFIVWYLKNIEKKIPLDFNENFKTPIDNGEKGEIKESYSFNEEELLKEVEELKTALNETTKDKEGKIKNLNEELNKYKAEINKLKTEEKKNKEALAIIKKKNAEPLIEVIQETLESNKELMKGNNSVIENIQAEDVIEGIKSNLKEVSSILKIINNEDELYKVSNVEKIKDEYIYINEAFKNLEKETLVLVYILLKELKEKKLINKKGLSLKFYLNSKFKKVGALESKKLHEEIKKEFLQLTKSPKGKFSGLEEVINNLHKEMFKEKNEGGVYLIDILNIYMEEMIKILKYKFQKSGSIKKVMLFTKVIGEVSSEDTIVILNLMRKYYSKEDINIEGLIQLDIESISGILKSADNLTEYITLSKFIIILIDGLKYKRDKVFKEILNNLKEKQLNEKDIYLILAIAAIGLY